MVSDRVCKSRPHLRPCVAGSCGPSQKRRGRGRERKERERERVCVCFLLAPSRYSTSSFHLWRDLTRQWHDNSERGSRTARDNEETFSSRSDGCTMNFFSPCTFSLFPRFPSHRCCLPRCRFSSGLHNGVICRHRDDDDNDGESQLCEIALYIPGMRGARWLGNFWKSAFALKKRDLSILFASLSGNSLRYSETNEVCATSQWQCRKDALKAWATAFLILCYLKIYIILHRENTQY